MSTPRVWIVDDDRGVRFVLATALREAGYAVDGFENTHDVLDAIERRDGSGPLAPDLIFTDVRMPGDDGLALLEKLKTVQPQLPVIVMSAYTDIASTAGAFRGGAHEYLSKPFDLDHAVALAARVLAATGAARSALGPALAAADTSAPALIGDTAAMRDLFRAIGRLAQAPLSVLITGETGTGKELVARAQAVHRTQHRSDPVRTAGKRTVRPRGWRVHRRDPAPDRTLRTGRRRHLVSGRDRRHAVAAADPAAAGAGRGRVFPRRRPRVDPG